ncbi:MAG: hypothetical protein LBL97_01015 [Prevotellaceae bacterium]|jgi:hypothetical protein|nr:hypothetical protein [Prevotellaceae bacterium]
MSNPSSATFRVGDEAFRLRYPATGIDISRMLPPLVPFLSPNGASPLFTVTLLPPKSHADSPARPAAVATIADFTWDAGSCRIEALDFEQDHHRITLHPYQSDTRYTIACSDHFAQAELRMQDNGCDAFVLNNLLMMLYAFCTAPQQRLLMHASVIACAGKGYLFLGKSGTGKSTHSRLWLDYVAGSELLNDDNPVVGISHGEVTVYGSPWSGKTPCYKNRKLPVGAFVRLEQAPVNAIRREGAARAFASLLPSCSCLHQDQGVSAGVVSTVKRIAAQTPVYHLQCLPDADAVFLAHQTITHP